MDYLAFPPARSVAGTVCVPASKSATNRALVLAALSATEVKIVRPLDSADTRSLARCLEAMGATILPSPEGLSIKGPLRGRGDEEILLDAGDSGTAARFLAAVAAASPGRFLLTGSARLMQRPIGELAAALASGGADLSFRGAEGFLPLSIRGGTLAPGLLEVDASRSSQFVSALLLAGIAVEGGLAVRPTGPIASAPYVRTTLETLSAFGHRVSPGPVLRSARGDSEVARYAPPGDYSSGVPLLAAAGAAGGTVSVAGLAWPSHDADAQALPALESLGLRVMRVKGGIAAAGQAGKLTGADISAGEFPDAVPALAALAALSDGESRLGGIGHLRYKESDRIASLAELLNRAGARAEAQTDALVVAGPIRPASRGAVRLPTFDDHRIAMAAALLSLSVPGLLIENPGCVGKSYPAFFRDLESLARR
ncbi:MAG: 3-phosphoshikimate 1-carboxyvinyltransferase [Thermoanaerobaculia bacterium]